MLKMSEEPQCHVLAVLEGRVTLVVGFRHQSQQRNVLVLGVSADLQGLVENHLHHVLRLSAALLLHVPDHQVVLSLDDGGGGDDVRVPWPREVAVSLELDDHKIVVITEFGLDRAFFDFGVPLVHPEIGLDDIERVHALHFNNHFYSMWMSRIDKCFPIFVISKYCIIGVHANLFN